MKKINIICSGALLLALASCDDKSDLGVMQVNEQLPIMSAEGVKTGYGAALQGDALNLNNYLSLGALDPSVDIVSKNEMVPLYECESAENLPAGAEVTFNVQFANNENFEGADEMALTDGAVLASEIERVFQNFYQKDPRPHDMWVRFAAFVKEGSQVSRIGNLETWFGSKKISVTPVDLLIPVQESYSYQAYIGGAAQTPIVMGHSSKHPYDDPIFSTTVIVSSDEAAAGYEWDIVAADGTVYYPAADGTLVVDGSRGVISSLGNYRLVANMLDLTYEMTLAYDELNTPGNANGWDVAGKTWCLGTQDYTNYYGYIWLDGEFKVAAGSWDLNWGVGSSEGTLAQGGGNIIPSDGAGLYYMTMNLESLTYTLVKIESIGAIGGFNGWGAQEPMTISDNGLSIKGTVTFAEGDEWKFRANDNWDINLGGSMENLIPNGDNLFAPGAGEYEISLNLSTLPYTCTVVAK